MRVTISHKHCWHAFGPHHPYGERATNLNHIIKRSRRCWLVSKDWLAHKAQRCSRTKGAQTPKASIPKVLTSNGSTDNEAKLFRHWRWLGQTLDFRMAHTRPRRLETLDSRHTVDSTWTTMKAKTKHPRGLPRAARLR